MYPLKSSEKIRYAGFGIRMLASFIDSILVLIIILPILLHTYGWAYLFPTELFQNDQALMLIARGPVDFFLSYVFPALVVVIFWMFRSSTPGKMMLSLVIIDATSGAPLTKKQCIIRYLAYYVSLLPLGIGFLVILFDAKRQGWHDKLANTVVVYKN